MRIKGNIATSNLDIDGEIFDQECLREIAENKVLPRMVLDFSSKEEIGDVSDLYMENGRLFVDGIVYDEKVIAAVNKEVLNCYLVPKYEIDDMDKFTDSEGNTVVTRAKLHSISFTVAPVDISLFEIEKK